MPAARPARGGGRWVDVAPERLDGFLRRFGERHGALTVTPSTSTVLVTAADGSEAECHVPFPPLTVDETAAYGGLVAHALTDRTVGVVLVRRGGFAAGVFEGEALL